MKTKLSCRRFLPSSFLLAIVSALPVFANSHVNLSRPSFNPRLHETVTYALKITEPGTLTARILDRDTYVVKSLATNRHVTAGTLALTWDGTDTKGNVVADEAWSVHVEFHGKHPWTYFPASAPATMTSIKPDFFDRTSGILRYTLPTASRVHLQAGIADHSGTGQTSGAVMKTLVNRAPRPVGAVVEQWTGMDESGSIYVPGLRNFVVAIAATPLPENSVITYGNRDHDFLTTALRRTGSPLLISDLHSSHGHHQGLTALDDATPRLTTALDHAQWDKTTKSWTAPRALHITLGLDGPTAARFSEQPGRLIVYVDDHMVVDRRTSKGHDLDLRLPDGPDHVVAVNWVSDYGPVAATAFRAHTD